MQIIFYETLQAERDIYFKMKNLLAWSALRVEIHLDQGWPTRGYFTLLYSHTPVDHRPSVFSFHWWRFLAWARSSPNDIFLLQVIRGPNSNRESVIFRYFGCIFPVFCYHAAQKVNIFDKFSKLRLRDHPSFRLFDIKYLFTH